MFVSILLVVVCVAVFASLMNQGLWSNTINLINVITSGFVATTYFEPVAGWMDKNFGDGGTYIYDLFALWILFGVTMVLLRTATDWISQVKVRFFLPVEKVGGLLMAVWTTWIVLCFTTMSLHTAPLSRNFIGFQPDPDAKNFFGLGPDRIWLGWVHRESQGPLDRFGGAATFDPDGSFIYRYSNRRGEYDKNLGFLKAKGGPATPAPAAE